MDYTVLPNGKGFFFLSLHICNESTENKFKVYHVQFQVKIKKLREVYTVFHKL
mgnify:FL=1